MQASGFLEISYTPKTLKSLGNSSDNSYIPI